MMIKVWGVDKVNELDIKADEYSARIKMGIDPKYPTDLWLMRKISELKSDAEMSEDIKFYIKVYKQ